MDYNTLFEKAVFNWRDNKGIGTAFVPTPLNDKILVYQILLKLYTRSPTVNTLIIVNNFQERTAIIDFITNVGDEENDKEFKQLINNKLIKVFTVSFIIDTNWSKLSTLCIWYRPNELNETIYKYIEKCKFKLVVLSKLFTNSTDSSNLYKLAPILDCFKQSELDELRVSTPVEETWIGVDIAKDSQTWKLYEYYTKYIETTINIFGSFDKIQEARIGNTSLNISASEICTQIAVNNGWDEHLDMNYEYNRKIDDMYNPNSLRERASQVYEYTRLRSNLLSDCENKLSYILDIVNANSDKKILIISKRGEFANKVTEYLNNYSETNICGNYHNKTDDIDAVDINGNPIYIKSGKSKGKRKILGYKAQMTLNQNLFNENKLKCLSLSNAPDKSLNVDVDVIIITSPLCEDIESFIYRLSDVNFNKEKIKLFSIFCKNTTEEQKIMNKSCKPSHTILNKSEFTDIVENKFDFIVVD